MALRPRQQAELPRRGRRGVALLALLVVLPACGGASSGDVCEQGTIGPCDDTNELQTFFPEP